MYCYKLTCPCGFQSNDVGMGSNIEQPEYRLPVFVPGDETLYELIINAREHETHEEYEARLDANLETEIQSALQQQFDENAECLNGEGAVEGNQVVCCPVCHQETARFQFSGF